MSTTTLMQAPDQYQVMLNNYANIVERTNQQMNYWFDPYVLIIALLTVLFTIGAIVAAVLIYSNSSEAKKQRKKFFEDLEKNVEKQREIIEERNKKEDERSQKREERAKEYETKFNDLIDVYEDKLGKLDDGSKEEIERVEKIVDNLNKAKASLSSYEIPEAEEIPYGDISVSGYHSITHQPEHNTVCLNCNLEFRYKDKNVNRFGTASAILFNKKRVKCPHCGFQNDIF